MALKLKTKNSKLKTKKFGKIGVLMGGPSTEREISLKSGKAIFNALHNLGLDVVAIDIKTDNIRQNIKMIKTYKLDCAFLALHGRFGEDGQIQFILDSLEIKYTGSGTLSSRLAMDKIASRKVLEIYGVKVPGYRVLEKTSYNRDSVFKNGFSYPVVVKPASHGSSIGLSIVDKKEDLSLALDNAFSFDDRLLLEDYIKGRELTVGILDKRALPVVEVIPKRRFFDYQAKYTAGLTDYQVPADLDESLAQEIQKVAQEVHELLGCHGYSRVDIMLDEFNKPVVLEVNTIPGFTETSLFPKAARLVGIEFGQLCLELLRLAHEKK